MGVRIRTVIRQHRIVSGVSVVSMTAALILWYLLALSPTITTLGSFLSIGIVGFCLFVTSILLLLRFFTPSPTWVKVWLIVSPLLLSSMLLFPHLSHVTAFCLIPPIWLFFALWGYYRFYPLTADHRLHKARFARRDEVATLSSEKPVGTSLLVGVNHLTNHFALVRPTQTRRELGNLMVVAPTRGGKGLRVISQLLSWQHSVVVNDIKGELFKATAGYRSTLGNVYVIDPTGVGHRYDPLLSKQTEEKLYSAAKKLLYVKDEKEPAFTLRATNMLTQLFLAARAENIPPLPYGRSLMKLGLRRTVERLESIRDAFAVEFLGDTVEEINFNDRFLVNCWNVLTSTMKPLLTETIVRCFSGSDFTAKELICGKYPVTVYFRWPEEDLLALSPLVRLLWGSLIDELIMTYDKQEGKGCKPVLLEIDEAGRAPIPTLSEHATTVVGRGITIDMSVQSLEQLRVEYGEARAQVLRDNMETQIYHRQADLETAEYLSRRIGSKSGYAHSQTEREGKELSQGLSEQGVPLMTPQEIMQMKDEKIICFHRRLPPFKLNRVDWRDHPILTQRHGMPVPRLPTLPPVPALSFSSHSSQKPEQFPNGYIDLDLLQSGSATNGITRRV